MRVGERYAEAFRKAIRRLGWRDAQDAAEAEVDAYRKYGQSTNTDPETGVITFNIHAIVEGMEL